MAPTIQPQSSPVIANENSQAVLDCVVTGNPPPTVSWFFNSASFPDPSLSRVQQTTNGSLVFSPVRKGDEGSYVCRASNSAGMQSATFQLRVYGMQVLVLNQCMHDIGEGGGEWGKEGEEEQFIFDCFDQEKSTFNFLQMLRNL